jgi:rhamnogalacturonyl hydrolase YesR
LAIANRAARCEGPNDEPEKRRIKIFKHRWLFVLLLVAGIMTLSLPAHAQKEFGKWPAGTSPREVGKRVAKHFVATPFVTTRVATQPAYINYPDSVAWYGALAFAQLSGDKDLSARLIHRFDPLWGAEASLIPHSDHVDHTVFGIVPLEIFIETREQKYSDLGKSMADKQWGNPPPDGLTSQTRYWIDDIYMVTSLQLQAYRATGDAKYLDRAALEMVSYLDKLQEPNGLFYHAPDVPFFWGRGDGWLAVGMAEMLHSMPADHPRRARIMEGYRKMMKSLLMYQDKDGMWHQLIDHPEAWAETSSTAMFTFAMITGVREGWLDKKVYGKAARKGWLGVVSYLDSNADVRNVCEGTGKKNDLQYYLDRARRTGDLHGQAPILWCASAFQR